VYAEAAMENLPKRAKFVLSTSLIMCNLLLENIALLGERAGGEKVSLLSSFT
jgi:hypothetical protein